MIRCVMFHQWPLCAMLLVGAMLCASESVKPSLGLGAAPAAHDPKEQALNEVAAGKQAMLDSHVDSGRIVDAALAFAKALHYFTAEADEDMICELKANIFWCKKRMDLKDLRRYLTGKDSDPQDAKLVAEIDALTAKRVSSSQAQGYLDSAITFAADHPEDSAQITSRFFEVAERFVGTDIGKQAQELSIAAEKRMIAEAKARHAVLYETIFTRREPSPPNDRDPVPPPADVLDAVTELKQRFKAEYAQRHFGQKRRFSAVLAQMAAVVIGSPAKQYALLEEATTFAKDAKDYYSVLTLSDQMASLFAINAQERKKSWLAKENRNPITTAMLTLLDSPLDKGANLVVGKYLCFELHEWKNGIPVLLQGADGDLKTVAEMELLKPETTKQQMELANHWYELGQKTKGADKDQMLARCCTWIERAYKDLSTLSRKLADVRWSGIRSKLPYNLINCSFRMDDDMWNKFPFKSIELSANGKRVDTGLTITCGMRVQLLACPSQLWHVSCPRKRWPNMPNVFDTNASGFDKVANATRGYPGVDFPVGCVCMSIDDGASSEIGLVEGFPRPSISEGKWGAQRTTHGLGELYLTPIFPPGCQGTGSISIKVCVIDD